MTHKQQIAVIEGRQRAERRAAYGEYAALERRVAVRREGDRQAVGKWFARFDAARMESGL